MKKYNLRSSHHPPPEEDGVEMADEEDEAEAPAPPKRPRCQTPEGAGGHSPEAAAADTAKTETRRNTKPQHSHQLHLKSVSSQTGDPASVSVAAAATDEAQEAEESTGTKITDLQPEVMDMVCRYCDTRSLLNLYRSCKWFYSMFHESNTFWKLLCFKEELANYPCINDKVTFLPAQAMGKAVVNKCSFLVLQAVINAESVKSNPSTSETTVDSSADKQIEDPSQKSSEAAASSSDPEISVSFCGSRFDNRHV